MNGLALKIINLRESKDWTPQNDDWSVFKRVDWKIQK